MKPDRRRGSAARKDGRDPNGRPSSKLPLVLVLLLIVGLVALKFRRHKPEELAAKVPAQSAEEPQIIASQKELVKMQRAGQQRSALLVTERAAGLAPLPLKKVNGRSVLKVDVKPFTRGCMSGDLDIIKQDMERRAASGPKLVLSVEPLDGRSDVKPVQKKLSLEELSQGFSTEIALEAVKNRQLLGLFLCSVPGKGTCAGLETPNMNELLVLQTDIRFQKRPAKDYPMRNKNYLFMLLVAYPDRLMIHDSRQSLESSRKRLDAALNKGGDPVSPLLISDVMKRLRAASSISAIVHSQSVQIPLPHKEAKCP